MGGGRKLNVTTKNAGVILHQAVLNIPEPPLDMGEVARAEWYEVWSYLTQMEIGTSVDFSVIIAYCNEVELYKEAVRELAVSKIEIAPTSGYKMPSPWIAIKNQSIANIIKISSEYGFTPAARAKLKLGGKKETKRDKLDNLLGG